MDKKDFLTTMKEDILDADMEISMDTKLADIEEWDSLSFVSFIGMAKSKADKKVEFKDVNAAETVEDLYKLLVEG